MSIRDSTSCGHLGTTTTTEAGSVQQWVLLVYHDAQGPLATARLRMLHDAFLLDRKEKSA